MSALAQAKSSFRPHQWLEYHNATTSDANAVVDLYNGGLPSAEDLGSITDPHQIPITLDEAVDFIVRHQRAMRPLWIASIAGTAVAWLSFLGFHERAGCGSTAELGIQVHWSLRRHGIGAALLQRARRMAPSMGFDRLVATIRSDNLASQGLFRSQGYRDWGNFPGVIRGIGFRHDLMIFGLELQTEPHLQLASQAADCN